MPDELAGLLEGLAPIRVEGRFWRHSSPRYPVLAGSPAGGRWSPPGLSALYLARPRECCVAEAYRSLVDGREGMRPDQSGPGERVEMLNQLASSSLSPSPEEPEQRYPRLSAGYFP